MGIGRIIGLALLALGVVLMIFGFTATDTLGEQASKVFFGRYTNETMAMIVGGIVSAVVGLCLTVFGARKEGA
jgi:hypothetical protein